MSKNKRHKHSEELLTDKNWQKPKVVYGSNLIGEITDTDEKYIVATMEIPWDLVKNEITNEPEAIFFVQDMRIESLKKIEEQAPDDVDLIIGLGGGSCHDTAKYLALKKDLRLVQYPTIFGGDAVATTAVGIRDQGKVSYIGTAYTDVIYVDFETIRKAPPELIKYGAADILSSYTAIKDWKFAAERGKDTVDDYYYTYSKDTLLKQLYENSHEIKNLTDQGIRTIVDLFLEYHLLAKRINTDRPQEGSEHFFAYNAEYVTKRTYIHGKLLALGLWVVGGFYYNEKEEIEDYLNKLGLDYSLESVGLSRSEFQETVKTLKDFVNSSGYYYSIVHENSLSDDQINEMLKSI